MSGVLMSGASSRQEPRLPWQHGCFPIASAQKLCSAALPLPPCAPFSPQIRLPWQTLAVLCVCRKEGRPFGPEIIFCPSLAFEPRLHEKGSVNSQAPGARQGCTEMQGEGEGAELPGAARSVSRSASRSVSRSLSRSVSRCRSPVRSCRRLSRADAALWRAAWPVAGAGELRATLFLWRKTKKLN